MNKAEEGKEIYEMQAVVCQTLANAKRLEIIHTLCDKELTVGELAKNMGIRTANLSQHLSLMKSNGIVEARRDGVRIYYRISNPKVVRACALMKEVLAERLAGDLRLSRKI